MTAKLHFDRIRDLSIKVPPRTLMLTERGKYPLRQVTGRIKTLDAYAALTDELEAQYELILGLLGKSAYVPLDVMETTVEELLAQAATHLDEDSVVRLRKVAGRLR